MHINHDIFEGLGWVFLFIFNIVGPIYLPKSIKRDVIDKKIGKFQGNLLLGFSVSYFIFMGFVLINTFDKLGKFITALKAIN